MKKSYLSKYNMDGYATRGKPMVKKDGGKYYSIQHYQGKHEGEFTVMEVDENGVENGQAQLFDRGILQLSWMMKSGKREGELTVYKKGVVDRVMRWDDLREAGKEGDDYRLRAIVNDESGKELLEEMIVGSGIVVYRGEFDGESRKREGFGIEQDEKSGLEKRSGYFKNGKLVHVCQEFRKVKDEDGNNTKMEMIEYGGEEDEDNVENLLDCSPIYIGDYAFDAKQFRFIRSGVGNVLNEYSGICEWIGKWDEEGSEVELNGGWYEKMKGERLLSNSLKDEIIVDYCLIYLTICP